MMTLLEQTLKNSHDWAVDRIHYLCEQNEDYEYENAYSIQSEFGEWLDPNIPELDIFSLEYLGD